MATGAILINKITQPSRGNITFNYEVDQQGVIGPIAFGSITTGTGPENVSVGSVLIPVPAGTGYFVFETTRHSGNRVDPIHLLDHRRQVL